MTAVSTKTSLKYSNELTTLTTKELELLEDIAKFKKVKKRGRIFNVGNKKQYVYLLAEGYVKLIFRSSKNKTLIKYVVQGDSLFGINVFTDDDISKETAEAISDISYYEIPTNVFKKLVSGNQEFATHVLSLIVNRLHDLEIRLENLMFKSAKERIQHFIKRTGERKGIKIGVDECLINHGLSHQEIALFVDTSRQTVARVFAELKKDNIIHFSPRKPRKILIRSMIAL